MSQPSELIPSSSKQELLTAEATANDHGSEQNVVRMRVSSQRSQTVMQQQGDTSLMASDHHKRTLKSARMAQHGTSSSQRAQEKENLERIRRIQESKFKEFVETYFSYRECVNFKPKSSDKAVTEHTQCQCGGEKREHIKKAFDTKKDAEKDKQTWSPADLQLFRPTNAYGKIEFICGNNENTGTKPVAEYVRISDEYKVKEGKDVQESKEGILRILELMVIHWEMTTPKFPSLCISVIGGAKNFKMKPKDQEVFNQGLIKAAQTTAAWIITSGLNLGVTKVVGEAIAAGQSFRYEKRATSQRLRCIGIAPWGYVLNRNELVNRTGLDAMRNPKTYVVSHDTPSGQPVSLNQNHTHYILVDDGKRRSYGGSYSSKIRAALESEISNPSKENVYLGQGGIPVVLIIVEGGHDVFLDASNSIDAGVPVVICKNTGRAADVLAYAARHADGLERDENSLFDALFKKSYFLDIYKESKESTEKRIEAIRDDGKREEERRNEAKKEADRRNEAREKIKNIILKDRKLVTVFDIRKEKAEDFDRAILYALIQREEGNESGALKQLQLALTWNRVDVAEKIFRNVRSIPIEALHMCMYEALRDDKTEFVLLFLQNGVVMRDFLTLGRLRGLYSESAKFEAFDKALMYFVNQTRRHPGTVIYLSTIRTFIRHLVGTYRNPIYDQDVPNTELEGSHDLELFADPFKELFLWSLLHCRHEMAKFMWERTDESIHLAVVASRIYQSMQKPLAAYDTETKERYESYKEEFENLAAGVLEECNVIHPEYAIKLVDKEYEMWGGMSTLELAASSNDKKFLSSVVSQNSLDFCWTKGLTAPYWLIVICIFFPFLIFFGNIIKFKIPQQCHHPEETKTGQHDHVDHSDLHEGHEGHEHYHEDHEHHEHPEMSQARGDLGCCRKLYLFYTAPKTKFVVNVLSYLFFVAFYSYFILFDISNERITPVEIVIFIYIGSIIIEEIREVYVSKAESFWEKIKAWFLFSEWNMLDILLIVLAVWAALMRISVAGLFDVSRTVYCIVAILIYMRILRLYSASENLGPKLVMIARMLRELVIFILIIGVALFCYGVTSLSLLYPSRNFTKQILLDVVYKPYWSIHGDMYLDYATATMDNCTSTFAFDNNTFQNDDGVTLCPQYHFLVPLFMAVYTMIGNVLLLNLLIAIFTNIFEEVQENSIEIWKFKMFTLVIEFKYKSYLPMPLNIVEDTVRFFILMFRLITCAKSKNSKKSQNHVGDEHSTLLAAELLNFESTCRVSLLRARHKQEKYRLEKMLEQTSAKVDQLGQNLENLYQQIQSKVTRLPSETSAGSIVGSDDALGLKKRISQLSAISNDTDGSSSARNDLGSATAQKGSAREKPETIHETDEIRQARIQQMKQEAERLNSLEERLSDFDAHLMSSMNILTQSRGQPADAAVAEADRRELRRMESRLSQLEENTTKSLQSIEILLRGMVSSAEPGAPSSSSSSQKQPRKSSATRRSGGLSPVEAALKAGEGQDDPPRLHPPPRKAHRSKQRRDAPDDESRL